MTQTWVTTEQPAGDRQSYEAVFCLACAQQHFICTATGRALGDTDARPTAVHSPVFPPRQIRRCHERVAPSIDVAPTAADIRPATSKAALFKIN